jgi:hypothetical protein
MSLKPMCKEIEFAMLRLLHLSEIPWEYRELTIKHRSVQTKMRPKSRGLYSRIKKVHKVRSGNRVLLHAPIFDTDLKPGPHTNDKVLVDISEMKVLGIIVQEIICFWEAIRLNSVHKLGRSRKARGRSRANEPASLGEDDYFLKNYQLRQRWIVLCKGPNDEEIIYDRRPRGKAATSAFIILDGFMFRYPVFMKLSQSFCQHDFYTPIGVPGANSIARCKICGLKKGNRIDDVEGDIWHNLDKMYIRRKQWKGNTWQEINKPTLSKL